MMRTLARRKIWRGFFDSAFGAGGGERPIGGTAFEQGVERFGEMALHLGVFIDVEPDEKGLVELPANDVTSAAVGLVAVLGQKESRLQVGLDILGRRVDSRDAFFQGSGKDRDAPLFLGIQLGWNDSGKVAFEQLPSTAVFDSMNSSASWYDRAKLNLDGKLEFPFVSRSRAGNGVVGFCPRQAKSPELGNAVTIGLDTQTVGYQPVAFYTSQNIQVLRHRLLDENNGLVLVALIEEQMGKFSWGGNGATLGRLKRTRIMVPVVETAGAQTVDWDGMSRYGRAVRARAERQSDPVLGTDALPRPD